MLSNHFQYFQFSENNFYQNFAQQCFSSAPTIKILMVGDVVGRPGRNALKKILPKFRESAKLDFITVNAENLAGGFGITEKIYQELCEVGVDVFTMGNHWKDKPDIHLLRRKYNNVVLPQNLLGVSDIDRVPSFYLTNWRVNINVINLMGNFAMKEQYKNPFEFLAHQKDNFDEKLSSGSHIMIADIHAETSSEKQAMAWYYNGIFAALIGTHTHTPTSDERLTALGTAFISDVGMTGAYESVLGMEKDAIIKKMLNPFEKKAHEVAKNNVWFCAFLVEVNPKTNLALSCCRLQCRMDEESQENWLVSKISGSLKRP